MENLKKELTVGELAERSGVAISAIHYYESKKLIYARRNSQNQRVFPRGILRLVSIIKVAQKLGLSLDQIKAKFSVLPKNGPPSEDHWQSMARDFDVELDKQIVYLKLLKKQLKTCIGCGCLSLKQCPLRNPGDVLAENGPGAHLI